MATMTKPFDISKFRKDVTKNIKGISTGFNDPKTWISTGSYVLDYLISNDFFRGIPLEGKFSVFAGNSGAGKSYLCSGNLVKNAQEQGIFVVLFDTENALDESWLQKLGVDTSEEALMKITVSMIDDASKFMFEFIDNYKKEFASTNENDKPKILFVIDSLGMLITPTEQDQFEKGDMKGDMGRKAKALASMCRNIVSKISSEPIGVVATNHTYASQDMFNPESKIAGGEGLVYASSVIVTMEKRKLKEDETGSKTAEVHGVRSAMQVRKSRYAKPFEKVEVKIPYSTGMDPFSGVFDLVEKAGYLVRRGNRYRYEFLDGTEYLDFKKNYTEEMLLNMIHDFKERKDNVDEVKELKEYETAEEGD